MMKFAILCSASALAFVSEHPETVRIKRGNDVVTINLDDYDEKRDGKQVTDDEVAHPAPNPPISQPPAPGIVVPAAPSAPNFGEPVAPQSVNDDTLSVVKEGRKFIVVYAKDAKPVEGFRDIDEAGYKTDGEAWAAITLAKLNWGQQQVETGGTKFPDAEAIEKAANEADGKA